MSVSGVDLFVGRALTWQRHQKLVSHYRHRLNLVGTSSTYLFSTYLINQNHPRYSLDTCGTHRFTLSAMYPTRRVGYICHVCRGIRGVAATTSNSCIKQTALRSYSTAAARNRPLHVAVIGSGPAGFYSAYRLQKKFEDVRIDMFEQLPVPYGLARFGVAPDHPEVKKCTETLIDVAKSPFFNYAGNVSIGTNEGELPLTAIAPHYDAIIFAYGASKDKKLGVPGEDLKGVLSARAFVGWYNGLPEYADLDPDLQAGETAIVIGQGNVALDVTRILLSPLEQLRQTDITEHALEALSKSKIRDVKVIGRRGPLQAPYTIKELRELLTLSGLGFAPPPEGWESLFDLPTKSLPRQLKRIAELLQKGSTTLLSDAERAWQLGYLRSPAAFLSQDGSTLHAVGFERTRFQAPASTLLTPNDPQANLNAIRNAAVTPTGAKSLVHASLAFRSVGYKSEPLAGLQAIGVPFDEHTGIIPNDRWGRVLSPALGPAGPLTAGHVPGMYCAGWVKRGPTGVIASTLDDAFTTADIVAKDWADGVPFAHGTGRDLSSARAPAGWSAVQREVQRRGIRSVSWADWERIDAEERRRGQTQGRERVKMRSVAEMLGFLDRNARDGKQQNGKQEQDNQKNAPVPLCEFACVRKDAQMEKAAKRIWGNLGSACLRGIHDVSGNAEMRRRGRDACTWRRGICIELRIGGARNLPSIRFGNYLLSFNPWENEFECRLGIGESAA
nr:nadph:adrenodoxin oxidoreductase, mitochondrial [Quercus suber]